MDWAVDNNAETLVPEVIRDWVNYDSFEASEYLSEMPKNKSLLGELWDFLKVRKAWWLAPILIMLILVGALIIFGQSSALSPFIYALF